MNELIYKAANDIFDVLEIQQEFSNADKLLIVKALEIRINTDILIDVMTKFHDEKRIQFAGIG